MLSNFGNLLRLASAIVPTSSSSMQDFGARDPYEAEVKSNFANKVLGNADTSHVIRHAACFAHTLLCVCPACFAVLAGQTDG